MFDSAAGAAGQSSGTRPRGRTRVDAAAL